MSSRRSNGQRQLDSSCTGHAPQVIASNHLQSSGSSALLLHDLRLTTPEMPSAIMAATTDRPRVFLDVSIGGDPVGRLTIELFVDKTPRTCEK